MMTVLTNGRILSVVGPFKATENDASITQKIFNNEASVSLNALQPGDVVIVDRGFRDCETMLINSGYIIKKPATNPRGRLTTKEANETRMLTRVRYNVERVNGVMKMVWKIFLNAIDIHYIPKIMDDFTIAALINKKLCLVTDTSRSVLIARTMKQKEKEPNSLTEIVESESVEKLIRNKSYCSFIDFLACPRLSIADLEMVSFGTYQVQQARCYLSNHMDVHGNGWTIFQFFNEDVQLVCKTLINPDMTPLLLMANIKSRFISKKVHRTFVLLNTIGEKHECVVAYSCSCKSGDRTVGCCSHIMSILYLVTQPNVKEISKHLDNVFDATTFNEQDEEEEDDSETEDY